MYGAVLGDIIGSPYEFDAGKKTKDFPLFGEYSIFTDDTVMTIAVADAILRCATKADEELQYAIIASMQKWGRIYYDAGYGGIFYGWLYSDHPKPYRSFGNGSAMRVSSVGWLYDSLKEVRHVARLSAEITHNHPEGIKGAEAIASAIYLARVGNGKYDIKRYIKCEFGYDLDRTCDEIRPTFHHVESCQETVPVAIIAFLEGENFEDVIRTAVSLGGDTDTIANMAGAIAEAYYGVPNSLKAECINRLPADMAEVLRKFAIVCKAKQR